MAKIFTLLQRKSGWSRAEFSDYWGSTHKEHALDLARAGFFTGYVQNHLIGETHNAVWPAADGIPEIWVPSTASLADIAASEIYQRGAQPDEGNFTNGEIASYISGDNSEQTLSPPESNIRHLVFLQLNSIEQVAQVTSCIDSDIQGPAADTTVTISAADGTTPCIVISGAWARIEAAQQALENLADRLMKLKEVKLLNAGLYRARTVVNPGTGRWDEAEAVHKAYS